MELEPKSSPAFFLHGGFELGGFTIYLYFVTGDALELCVYTWAIARRSRNRIAHALHGNGPGDISRVASRAALASELQAAGFNLLLKMSPQALLHLYRRRLTDTGRKEVLKSTAASHIVGDDGLCPSFGRFGPQLGDIWRTASKFRWADAAHPHPLVVFPDHLSRLRERVAHEFQHNPHVASITVVVSMARDKLDGVSDWSGFAASADQSLLEGWGDGLGIISAMSFKNPLPLLRYPSNERVIPPTKWDEDSLPVRFIAVALTIGRVAAEVSPTYLAVGSFQPIAELRSKDRAGLTRIMVEIDLVQRPRSERVDVGSFGRKAFTALMSGTPDGQSFPRLPLKSISQRGDMVYGFIDLPAERASQVLRASGSVRGVFARPWVNGGVAYPFPPGFGVDTHRVVWVKISRYSDVVFSALRTGGIAFDGLVCPRSRGEVGIRAARGADISDLTLFLADGYDARVKARAPDQRRFTLRASEVPLALMDKLSLMITRVDPDYRLVSSRIIRTTPYSMVVDMEVLGSSPLTGECRLDKLGMRPIVVKCLPPRRPVAPVRVVPTAKVPFPSRPLSSTERVSWANIVRSGPKPSDVAVRPVDAASVPSGMPRPAVDPDDDYAEIPLRRHSRPNRNPASSSASSSVVAPSSSQRPKFSPSGTEVGDVPKPAGKRGQSQNIYSFLAKKPAPSETPSTTVAYSSPSAPVTVAPRTSMPATTVWSAPTPPPFSAPPPSTVDAARFDALVAQVARLTTLLAEQTAANVALQKTLEAALAQQVALQLQLRTLKTRSRSADATVGASLIVDGDDARMDSEGEREPELKLRRSPRAGEHPTNV